ncbi:hypothetical protein ACCO45_000276 [Purpureocillium lilacinum]|uniref:Uncharacterized protein n=1 Tax=Purpureocillium lilacinum TaxID=33203 RepID=A0ACC4E530_PURLI
MSSKVVAKAAGGVMSISKPSLTRVARAETNPPVHGHLGDGAQGLRHRPGPLQRRALNPWYRNPPPGSNDPLAYDDPVTIPAGDIADNPYWKRDHRRSYPKLSVMGQGDVVQLLTVGSAAAPKLELIGEAGQKQLVAAKQEGETLGLAKALEKAAPKDVAKDVFVDGLPPLPSGQSLTSGAWDVHKYELTEENSYPQGYPCRTFQ